MLRLVVPLILVAAAIGLFAAYTDPTYQASKELQGQLAQYNDALTKSQQLKSVRDQLLSKRNTFSDSDVSKLETVLPDNVDNIRLIIDINNVAARHNLTLQNVSLGDVGNGVNGGSNALAAGSSGSAVNSVQVGFSVTTSYDGMLSFLNDLEHSLRLIDVEDLAFTAGGLDNDSYSFKIQTYWLQ